MVSRHIGALLGLCDCTGCLCHWYRLAARQVAWKGNEWCHLWAAPPLSLEINCQKTMVQAICFVANEPFNVLVCGNDVQRVGEFICLVSLIHSTCSSEPEICRHSAMIQTAMQSLVRHLCRSRITTRTKLCLYNVYILPVVLYGQSIRLMCSGLMHLINGACSRFSIFTGTVLSLMSMSAA